MKESKKFLLDRLQVPSPQMGLMLSAVKAHEIMVEYAKQESIKAQIELLQKIIDNSASAVDYYIEVEQNLSRLKKMTK